ncbi:MAG: nucleoside-diphosphate kinase [Melioribacteraceae bacterium]|jgi:nucleoside-diphosphate kinase|nr:nucleoside-diphosphate kinase [Melioribacteraceae bacterium]
MEDNKLSNRTLAILKPDCVRKNLAGTVIKQIQEAGFKVLALKMTKLTEDSAKGFYEVHKERPFFTELVEFMTSGPCIPIALEKDNAVAEFRKLIGATNPKEAEEGTIRRLYADSIGENIVHGSDSDENAAKEISHFFSRKEILENNGF